MILKFRNIIIILLMLNFLSACSTLSVSNHAGPNKKQAAARTNIQLGNAYMKRHDIERAKQKYLAAMREAPQMPEVWQAMGYFFEETGQKQRAAKCYERAMEYAKEVRT